jgi:hypothetical protein
MMRRLEPFVDLFLLGAEFSCFVLGVLSPLFMFLLMIKMLFI